MKVVDIVYSFCDKFCSLLPLAAGSGKHEMEEVSM